MDKFELISFLNEFLKIDRFKDSNKNWLQVDSGRSEIKKIGYAVDATSYIFDLAVENQIDLVLTHHWLFWWEENVLIDIYYERIAKLIKNDIALFAVHLPLDAHPVVGNNIGILSALVNILTKGKYQQKINQILTDFEKRIDEILDIDGIVYEDENFVIERFWIYHWIKIWYWIKFKKERFHWSEIITNFGQNMGFEKRFYNFWNKEFFSSVAVVSGWGGNLVKQAKQENYDIYLTWEANHWHLTFAKEIWQSIFLGWHRETEKIGPKLLAYYLKKKLGLDIVFLDEKY